MNNQPVDTLKKLIEQHGGDLSDDPRRTEALLNDLCPANRTEVFVLVNAQRQHIPADLLAAPRWMPLDATASRLSRRLQDRLALSEDAADWAVNSWAMALDLREKPSGLSKLIGSAQSLWRSADPSVQVEFEQQQSEQDVVQSTLSGSTEQPADDGGQDSTASPSQPDQDLVTALSPASDDKLVNTRLTWLAALASLLVLSWIAVSLTWPWRPIESALAKVGVTSAASRAVEKEYSLPRIAWVSDGPLNVRVKPDIAADRLAVLEPGTSVRVTEYSSDLNWSRIAEPYQGWVSNWYLNFLVSDHPEQTIRLIYMEMFTLDGGATVYSAPGVNGEILAVLDPDTVVETVAVTADGLIRHSVSPVRGWIDAGQLAAVSRNE